MTTQEQILCPVCERSSVRELFTSTDYNRRTTTAEFSIYRCEKCKTGVTVPRLSGEVLSSAYPQVYYNIQSYQDINIKTSKPYAYQLEKIRLVKRFVQTGKLLDVGCGIGSFVLVAREHGFDAEGIEMSSDAVEFGKKHFHLPLFCGDILSYPLQDNSFDVITLWHVFEHLPDPREVLGKIRNKFKEDGILIIAVPNFSSPQAKFFHGRWYHLDVPRHLFHYSPQGLATLLQHHGFSIESVEYFSYEHNWAGYLGSVIDIHSLNNESFFHKLTRKTYGYYLSHILAWVESMFKRGGTMTYIARKVR